MKKLIFLMIAALSFWMMSCGSSATQADGSATDTTEVAMEVTEPASVWEMDVPEADIAEPGTPAESPADAAVYVIDTEASTVKWKGSKPAYFHEGTIAISNGALSVAGGSVVAGNVEIDMTSIVNTDLTDPEKNAKLVGHLSSDDFFNAGAYPTSSLVLTGVEMGSDGQATVSGNLTIRDKTQHVTFPAEISVSEDGVEATALFSFDRSKFDVKFNSGVFFVDVAADQIIADQIPLYIELKAVPASSASAE